MPHRFFSQWAVWGCRWLFVRRPAAWPRRGTPAQGTPAPPVAGRPPPPRRRGHLSRGPARGGEGPWGVAPFDEMTRSEAVDTLILTNISQWMEKDPVMTASDVGYDCIHTWIKPILGPVHATVRRTMAWALRCLLLAQRGTPAALARALPAEHASAGRAGW